MKHIITLTLILLSLNTNAQVLAYGGAGYSQAFSAELGFGYRVSNSTLSVGYICQPRPDLPVYFNVKYGYQVGRVILQAGYTREMHSSDDKTMNKHGYDLGLKVSVIQYDSGDIYIGAGYTGKPYAHLGLSWNLFGSY